MMSPPKEPTRLVRISVIALWILSLLQLVGMAAHPFIQKMGERGIEGNHWDFRVYKAANEIYRRGGNPLDLEQLKTVGVDIPYNYSPAFSRATMWAIDGPAEAVEVRFVALKLIAIILGFLVLVWGLRLRGPLVALAAFLTTFGFGSALLVDMAAGNITGIEFLWMSLLAVGAFRRWDLMFLPALALLCLGKPIWGAFAVVPVLLYWDTRAWRSFGWGVLAFIAPLALSYGISPEATKQYLGNSFGFREHGYVNPCLREFLTDVMGVLGVGGRVATLVWFAVTLGLIRWVWIIRSSLRGNDTAGRAFGASALLLLPWILPRFKPYALALLIPFLIVALVHGHVGKRDSRRAVLIASAPFLVLANLQFWFFITYWGPGLLYWIGYLPLVLTTAAFLALNPGHVRRSTESVGRVWAGSRPLRTAVAIGTLVLIASSLGRSARYQSKSPRPDAFYTGSTDLATYRKAAQGVATGGVPYRDFAVEYPPTAAYYMALPALGRPPENDLGQAYASRFVLLTGVVTAALLAIYFLVAVRVAGVARAALFALSCAFAYTISSELTLWRFDAPTAVLTAVGGLLALAVLPSVRVSRFFGGLALGVATGLKLFPAIPLLAVVRSATKGERLSVVIGATVGLLPTFLLALFGPEGVKSFLGYHSGRHIEIGSIYSSLVRPFVTWRAETGFGSVECRFAGEGVVILLGSLLTLLAVAIPLFYLWRSRSRLSAYRFGVLALYGFVLFNKVGSPQYALWLLGASLIGVIDRPRRAFPSLIAATAGVLAASDSMSNFDYQGHLQALTTFVDWKNAVLCVGYGVALWAAFDARREERAEAVTAESGLSDRPDVSVLPTT